MANDFKFGSKAITDLYFGNKAVLQVYFGSKLIWPTLNLIMGEGNFICIEYIPKNNETINDATVFLNSGRVNGWMWIMHESGLCIARSTTESYEIKTLHNCSGYTAFNTNFNSPTLLKDNVYYFCFKTDQYDRDGNTFAYYSGKTGNYKKYAVPGGIEISNIDLSVHKFACITNDMADFYGKFKNDYLMFWTGGYVGSNWNINELLQATRDNSKIRAYITNDLISSLTSNAQKFALPYYLIGNIEGDEIVYLAHNGITWNNHTEFGSAFGKVYKGTGNITKNHITSLTPITEEPTNPETFGIWYKASGVTWGANTSSPYTQEGVVYWDGEKWADAANWTAEFEESKDSNNNTYTVDNIIIKIKGNDSPESGFGSASVLNDKKFYLAVNGVEY